MEETHNFKASGSNVRTTSKVSAVSEMIFDYSDDSDNEKIEKKEVKAKNNWKQVKSLTILDSNKNSVINIASNNLSKLKNVDNNIFKEVVNNIDEEEKKDNKKNIIIKKNKIGNIIPIKTIDKESKIEILKAIKASEVLNDNLVTIKGEKNYFFDEHNNNLLGYLPFIGKLFRGCLVKNVRRIGEPLNWNAKDSNIYSTMRPGILTFNILTDALSFKWLKYMDRDGAKIREQYTAIYANIGLLSALIFTVWVTFDVENNSPEPHDSLMDMGFSISWTIAAVCAFTSTTLSIILLLAINQTSCDEEAKHFIDLLDECSNGIGGMVPMLFFSFCWLFGMIGWGFWNTNIYGFGQITKFSLITGFTIFVISFVFILRIVSCLQCARKHDQRLKDSTQVHIITLNLDQIKEFVDEFLKHKRYILEYGNHESVHKFTNFIRFECLYEKNKDGTRGNLKKDTIIGNHSMNLAAEYFSRTVSKMIDHSIQKHMKIYEERCD